MKPPKDFLTPEGKQYARYIFLSHKYISNLPFVGKYITGVVVSLVYTAIIKEGAREHQRRRENAARRKAEMSRMRNGVSVSRERITGEVPEMRIRNQGIRSDEPVVSSLREIEETSKEIN